jgi:adenosylcobinamide kinase/adenosylcobinamide-phosphate guanylyltransferase
MAELNMSALVNLEQPGFTLVLGGQRSGKSVFAEQLIENIGGGVYIATSDPLDNDMATRILVHQKRRGDLWQTIEEPILLVRTLLSLKGHRKPVLVDCLTLWLTNIMLLNKNIDTEIDNLCTSVESIDFPVVFVSNEVGQGIIPDNALARQFVDWAGKMNQKIAEVSDKVIFVTAGLPQILK